MNGTALGWVKESKDEEEKMLSCSFRRLKTYEHKECQIEKKNFFQISPIYAVNCIIFYKFHSFSSNFISICMWWRQFHMLFNIVLSFLIDFFFIFPAQTKNLKGDPCKIIYVPFLPFIWIIDFGEVFCSHSFC